jgi:aryl-alcohol dehydrogenase-like predicted oxidoreductase
MAASQVLNPQIIGTAYPLKSECLQTVSRRSQLEDNLAALEHKNKMTHEALEAIDKILGNKPPAPERF